MKPCKFGHTERRADGKCAVCDRERIRARYRKNSDEHNAKSKAWRNKNADRKRETDRAYYAANAERRRKAARDAYAKDPILALKVIDRALAWQIENKERRSEICAKSNAKHREKKLAAEREWRQRNPDKELARCRKRQTAMARRLPSWANLKAIEEVYAKARQATIETGTAHHVDHVYPLRGKLVSGLHVHQNLQVIPARDNLVKGRRMPQEA